MATKKRAVRKYPSEQELKYCRDLVKPPGILSNNYTKQSLKKVDRVYISSKDATSTDGIIPMHQIDYRSPKQFNEETKYFNVTTERWTQRDYDRINNNMEGYNSKLHRDDREHAKSRGLNLHQEEVLRPVPATTNAIYGRQRLPQLERSQTKNLNGNVRV